jgi:hypothetical protein
VPGSGLFAIKLLRAVLRHFKVPCFIKICLSNCALFLVSLNLNLPLSVEPYE